MSKLPDRLAFAGSVATAGRICDKNIEIKVVIINVKLIVNKF